MSVFKRQEMGFHLGYGLGCPGFESRQEQEVFFFSKTSRPALGPTHLPMQQVPGSFPADKATGTIFLATHLHLAPRLE
jgi:hypothetical protein